MQSRWWCWGALVLMLAGCPSNPPLDAGMDSGALDTPILGPLDVPLPDGPTVEEPARPDAPEQDVPTLADSGGCDAGTAIETCNGIDDDCDGMRDEGCTCMPSVPVAIDDGFHMSLTMADDGTLATARYDFGTGAYSVRRYDSAFAAIGGAIDLVVDDTRPSNDLMLFPLGSDVAGLWRQAPSAGSAAESVWLARVDGATGAIEVPALDLSPDPGGIGHAAAPFGAGFVMARNENTPVAGIAVRLFDRDGSLLFGPHPIVEPLSVSYVGVGVIGTAIGVAYQAASGTQDIRFARFDAAGMAVGVSVPVGSGVRPHVAAQASGWAIVWEEGAGIGFASFAPDGSVLVAARMLGGGGGQGLAIAADGSGGWGVVFRGGIGTSFLHLDAAGAVVGNAEIAGYAVDGRGVLVHDGSRFVAALFNPGSALWVPCETR